MNREVGAVNTPYRTISSMGLFGNNKQTQVRLFPMSFVNQFLSLKLQRKCKEARFEVFMAVTMKNAVFRDIKSQLLHNRKHITSPLQRSAG
jgi:hypothetical protein